MGLSGKMTGQLSETVECPNCQYPNDKAAESCVRCGTQFLRTIPVAPQPEAQAPRLPQTDQAHLPKTAPGTITFIVAGYPQPLVVRNKGDIVLGRRMPDESAPTVDMTQYNGHLLGVSRRHAVINFKDQVYTLEDLNSTNGTWVNENKLAPNQPCPLQGGDQIRLGNLILFVYFSTVTSIYLNDPQQVIQSSASLTPHYLEQKLVPYLSALMQVQHVIDAILERDPSEVVIRSITAGPKNVIEVKLDGTLDAVKLVKEIVDPKKRGRSGTVPEHEAETGAAQRSGSPGQPPREDHFRLAQLIVFKVKPALSEIQVADYSQQLAEPLRTLIDCPLQISDTPFE
jgi:hypothetical protein